VADLAGERLHRLRVVLDYFDSSALVKLVLDEDRSGLGAALRDRRLREGVLPAGLPRRRARGPKQRSAPAVGRAARCPGRGYLGRSRAAAARRHTSRPGAPLGPPTGRRPAASSRKPDWRQVGFPCPTSHSAVRRRSPALASWAVRRHAAGYRARSARAASRRPRCLRRAAGPHRHRPTSAAPLPRSPPRHAASWP